MTNLFVMMHQFSSSWVWMVPHTGKARRPNNWYSLPPEHSKGLIALTCLSQWSKAIPVMNMNDYNHQTISMAQFENEVWGRQQSACNEKNMFLPNRNK